MVIKSTIMRRAGHVARMREIRNAYKTLVGKPGEEKIPLWTHRRVYPKVSGLSENCKWYSSLPLGAVVSLFYESVE
jgi:hypothetical protein